MKPSLLLTGLWIVAFFLFAWRSPLCSQEAPAGKRTKELKIEGVWTQVCVDMGGEVISFLPERQPTMLNMPGVPGPYLWRFSKEKIEKGSGDRRYPQWKYRYTLDPGGQVGAIDLIALDKNKEKSKGIYLVRDDWMMICFNRKARPKGFATSSQPDSPWVYILRRGKLK